MNTLFVAVVINVGISRRRDSIINILIQAALMHPKFIESLKRKDLHNDFKDFLAEIDEKCHLADMCKDENCKWEPKK